MQFSVLYVLLERLHPRGYIAHIVTGPGDTKPVGSPLYRARTCRSRDDAKARINHKLRGLAARIEYIDA